MRRVGAVICGAVMLVVASACAPSVASAPSGVDSLDLAALGRYSAPAYTVSASTYEDHNPLGPEGAGLNITARDSAGNIVANLKVAEYNVWVPATPIAVGSYGVLFAPPHSRSFAITMGSGTPDTSFIGSLDVTEIELGPTVHNIKGWTNDVTHLRATFTVASASGLISGSVVIG